MTASPVRRPAAGPVPGALVLSVADLLRREGRRAPHAGHGPLLPRGHASFPVPSVVAVPRTRRRIAAATGMVVVAGAVVGAAMTIDPAELGPATTPLLDPTGSVGAAGDGATDPFSAFGAPGTGPSGAGPFGPGPYGAAPSGPGPYSAGPYSAAASDAAAPATVPLAVAPLALDAPAVDGASLVEMVRGAGTAAPTPGPPVVTGADIAALLTESPATGGNGSTGDNRSADGRSGNEDRAGSAEDLGRGAPPRPVDTVVLRAVSAPATDSRDADAPTAGASDEPGLRPTADEPRPAPLAPVRSAFARPGAVQAADDRATVEDLVPDDLLFPDGGASEEVEPSGSEGTDDRSEDDRSGDDRTGSDRTGSDRDGDDVPVFGAFDPDRFPSDSDRSDSDPSGSGDSDGSTTGPDDSADGSADDSGRSDRGEDAGDGNDPAGGSTADDSTDDDSTDDDRSTAATA